MSGRDVDMKMRKAYGRLSVISLNIKQEGPLMISSGETYNVTENETEIIAEEFDDGFDFGTVTF